MLLSAALSDCWRRGAKDPLSSVDLSYRCRGLWGECIRDNVAGMWTCDVTLSYLEHQPANILSMRVALVLICGVSAISNLLLAPSLMCTRLISDSIHKRRLMRASGALLLVGDMLFPSGVCGTAGLLWFAVDTFIRYRQEVAFGIPGITYELGLSYWLGVGGVACILTSATTILTIRPASQRRDVIGMNLVPRTAQKGLSRTPTNTQPRSPGERTYI
ncbi:claudin-16-like [Osmerus mordax]|uniref:claudin-16-like n=1 Tax=Osmerus mordax TaxID=8014 RepID=UPI00350F8FD9